MGARGPKKKPQEVINLRGTTRKNRMREIKKGELVTDVSVILTDKGLDLLKTERMQEIFRDTCNMLIALKLLEQSYLHMLIMYAYNYAMWEQISQEVLEEGVTRTVHVVTKSGESYDTEEMNPKVKLQKQYGEVAAKIADLFGLTPVSRQKMPSGKVDETPAMQLMEALTGKKR